MAEGVRFERTGPKPDGFQDRSLKPLGQPSMKTGSSGGTRTHSPLIKSQLRLPLRYAGMKMELVGVSRFELPLNGS